MSLANCGRCGKVYAKVAGSRDLCPDCVKEEESNFRLVFQFMAETPSATAAEISQGTGVELKEIYKFVRENRLRLVRTEMSLQCEGCGNPISHGKLCEKCLALEIKNNLNKIKTDQNQRIHRDKPDSDPRHLTHRRGKGK